MTRTVSPILWSWGAVQSALLVSTTLTAAVVVASEPLTPIDTQPLELVGDPASLMIDGIDAFLQRKTGDVDASRDALWDLDLSDASTWGALIDSRRERLREMLGLVDQRVPMVRMESMAGPSDSGLLAESDAVRVYGVRWPSLVDPAPATGSLPSIWGEGLLLVPKGDILADIVALPDADQSPEALCGLEPGIARESQFPMRLAANGCRVVVPFLSARQREKREGRATLTDREYLHRSAFVLGRTLPGYEIQKVLAAVDALHASGEERPIGGIGYGEGGHLITLAAAIDERVSAVGVSGFYGTRSGMWQEPLDRNLNGFVSEFDAPHLGLMIVPRSLVVEASGGPKVRIPGDGGAPGFLLPVEVSETQRAVAQLRRLTAPLAVRFGWSPSIDLVIPDRSQDEFGSQAFVARLLSRLLDSDFITEWPQGSGGKLRVHEAEPMRERRQERRRQSQVAEIDRHNQLLWRESSFVRAEYFADLDRSSLDAFGRTVEPYRDRFRDDVIGRFEEPLTPPNPRTRKSWETETWTGYEVVLDVFPEVFAYGVLLLPKDLGPDERRPVVVCQHGLEGRPTDTFLGDHRAYHDYAAKLCEQGFVVFAPQNPYIFGDRFRVLQRKAQPLGCSLFSIIVPQHQQIVNWLQSQPFVDGERIAFYGLSYGGKSAMRVPALVTDYCLSICSADFNEWVLKNVSTRDRFSYVWTHEYEIFEWNLGGTFNYAEMAALICPRPFMVERGHFDGVGVDEWVAHEYAKVRYLYAAQLGIPERTEIEWFVGPHTIHGQATFEFLKRHLGWPAKSR